MLRYTYKHSHGGIFAYEGTAKERTTLKNVQICTDSEREQSTYMYVYARIQRDRKIDVDTSVMKVYTERESERERVSE